MSADGSKRTYTVKSAPVGAVGEDTAKSTGAETARRSLSSAAGNVVFATRRLRSLFPQRSGRDLHTDFKIGCLRL